MIGFKAIHCLCAGMGLWLGVQMHGQSAARPGDILPPEEVRSNDAPPVYRGEAWRIASYVEDAGLKGNNIFSADLNDKGTAWIATSAGLYRFDGYSWDRFTMDEGLPSNFVRCVHITGDGLVWVGTDRGASVLNPLLLSFESHDSAARLAGPSVRRIREDPDGTLWFCSDSWPNFETPGGLTQYRDGEWTIHGAGKGLTSKHVMDYFHSSKGERFALTQDGLFQWRDGRWFQPLKQAGIDTGRLSFWSMAENPDGSLAVNAKSAMVHFRDGDWTVLQKGLVRPYDSEAGDRLDPRARDLSAFGTNGALFSSPFEPAILCLRTESQMHAFFQWNGSHYSQITKNFPTHYYSIVEDITLAPDGSLWAMGYQLLSRWNRTPANWSVYPGLPTPRFVDREGWVWFFRDEDSYARLYRNETWQVRSIQGKLLLDASRNVWSWNSDSLECLTDPNLGAWDFADFDLTEVDRVISDGGGVLWAHGRGANGKTSLACFDNRKGMRVVHPELKDAVIRLSVSDPDDGIWLLYRDGSAEHRMRLAHVGNKRMESQPFDLTFPDQVRWIHVDRKRALWAYGASGLYRLEEQPEPVWNKVKDIRGHNIFIMVESRGRLWLSYNGASGGQGGLSMFQDGRWENYNVPVGNGARQAADHSVLFAGEQAVYYMAEETDWKPVQLSVPKLDIIHECLKDSEDSFWIQIADQVMRYVPGASPPETTLTLHTRRVRTGDPIHFQAGGIDRFQPGNANRQFAFSYRIQGGSWSPYVTASNMQMATGEFEPGHYWLEVRARNEDLAKDPTPVLASLTITDIPLQDRHWFLSLVGGIILCISGLLVFVYALHSRTKQSRNQLAALSKELTRSNEELELYAFTASHDLKEPLRGVVDCLDLFQEDYASTLEPRAREFIYHAKTSAIRLQSMINGLLEYSKVSREPVRKTPVDCHKALDQALNNLQLLIQETQAEITWGPLPVIHAQPVQLCQLFQNLLVNAMNFRGNDIPRIHVQANRNEDEWIFEVRDNGVGIESRLQPRVFELFWKYSRKNDSVKPGCGIGLSICRRIVERQQGRIWLKSEPGEGTSVFFSFPAG